MSKEVQPIDPVVVLEVATGQRGAAVVRFEDGSFAVVFKTREVVDGNAVRSIKAWYFDSQGKPGEIVVLTSQSTTIGGFVPPSQQAVAAAVTGDGMFVTSNLDAAGVYLMALGFLEELPVPTIEILAPALNTHVRDFDLVGLPDGRIVSIFSLEEITAEKFESRILATVVSPEGVPSAPVEIAGGDGRYVAVPDLSYDPATGRLLFSGLELSGSGAATQTSIVMAAFDPDNPNDVTILPGPVPVARNQDFPRSAVLANGTHAVIWGDYPPGEQPNVQIQFFTPDGASGPPIRFGFGETGYWYPEIFSKPDGGAIAVFQVHEGGPPGVAPGVVMGQHFTADGNKVGGEFLVADGGMSSVTSIGMAFGADGTMLTAVNTTDDLADSLLSVRNFDVPILLHGTLSGDVLDVASPDGGVAAGLAGDDVINGSEGEDLLFGGDGNDQLFGNGGPDTLFGGVGDDILDGGAAHEVRDGGGNLIGGQGNVLVPGAGNNTVIVRSALDIVDNGIIYPDQPGRPLANNEIVSHADFWWDLYGAGSRLVIAEETAGSFVISAMIGWLFDSEIVGNTGDNIMFTVGGNNVVEPGPGVDWIALGEIDGYRGVDRLVIEKNEGEDPSWAVVWGFKPEEDIVDLSRLGLGSAQQVLAGGFDFGGHAAFILDGTSNIVFLVDVPLHTLGEGDFIV